MIVKNDRIQECTEDELFMFWLKRWSDLFDWYEYKKQIKKLGVKIREVQDDNIKRYNK